MVQVKEKLESELERIGSNVAKKREILLEIAHSRSRRKKSLTLTSGILALLSASAITTTLFTLFGNQGLQILAALTSAGAGILSLIISSYKDDEIQKMFAGSSAYLALRENLTDIQLEPDLSAKELFMRIQTAKHEYAELDLLYSQFFIHSKKNATFNEAIDNETLPAGYLSNHTFKHRPR